MDNLTIGIAYPSFKEFFETSFEQPIIDLSKNVSKISECNLIIFSGGEDINPKIYRQMPTFSRDINDERDMIEIEIFSKALKLGHAKILGICRGHQLINCLLGGALSQDLYLCDKIIHKGMHTLEFLNPSELLYPYRDKLINSMHHQGVVAKGNNLNAIAYHQRSEITGNYILECTANENIFTTQFHPEFMHNPETKLFFTKIKEWALQKLPKSRKSTTRIPHYSASLNDESTVTQNRTERFFTLNPYEIPHEIFVDTAVASSDDDANFMEWDDE